MSCLSAINSQIFTFILAPHEILSLQHKVFQEYAKVALSSDFSHTFPSFILITAVCIALRRSLNLNWLRIPTNHKFLHKTARYFLSWIIINAALWHWLIIQRVLYCVVWTYWSNDVEALEHYGPWWKRVFSSFYPPSKRPVLSAGFISWILSMTISILTLLFTIYLNNITSIFKRASGSIGSHFKTMKTYHMSSLKKLRALTPCFDMGDEILTDKSEVGSCCDECRSDISTDDINYNMTAPKGIFSICNGTNWKPTPKFEGKKS